MKKKMSFEEGLAVLETVTNTLETGDIPLDQALSEYKKGLEMIALCQSYLAEVEGSLKILTDDGAKDFALPVQE